MKALRLLLFAVLLPACAAAQTDSVVVTVTDRTSLRLTITTTRLSGEPGDTVTFEAIAVDTLTGDTIDVVIRWSSDSPAVEIDATTGFATFTGDCGAVICRAVVFADVERIVSIVVFRLWPDGWGEVYAVEREATYGRQGFAPPRNVLRVGEVIQLCAYLVSDEGVWFRSSEACPSDVMGNSVALPIVRGLGRVLVG